MLRWTQRLILFSLMLMSVNAKTLTGNFRLAVLPPAGPEGDITLLSDYFADMSGNINITKSGILLDNILIQRFLMSKKWAPNLIPDVKLLNEISQNLGVDFLLVGSYSDLGMHFQMSYQVLDVKNGQVVKEARVTVKKDKIIEDLNEKPSKWYEFEANEEAESAEGWGTPVVNNVKPIINDNYNIVGCYVGTLVLCRIEIYSSETDAAVIQENSEAYYCSTETGKKLKMQLERISVPSPMVDNPKLNLVKTELLFSPVGGSGGMGLKMGTCNIPYIQSKKNKSIKLDNQRFRKK